MWVLLNFEPQTKIIRLSVSNMKLILLLISAHNDNFRKIVITKDDVHPWHNEEGILFVGLFDFLLKDEIDL